MLEAAEKHGITIRFTHTPGIKLDRPDQTSRGDPVEEPRVRFNAESYHLLSRAHGPFTELMGAERQHGGNGSATGKAAIWVHPTFNTVGSALRRLGERLMAPDGERARGVVVVPDDGAPKWNQLLRHFNVVGRRPEGDQHLEMSKHGK